MPREFENPKYAHQSNDPKNGQGHRLLTVALPFRELGPQSDEIGDDGHNVNNVHDVFGERGFAGAREETHEQLKGEPDDAQSLHHKERVREGTDEERESCVRQRRDRLRVSVVPELG